MLLKFSFTSNTRDVFIFHLSSSNVLQKQACMCLRNLVARNQEHQQHFLELGAEDLLQHALTMPECHDEAKAALRDLGCQVALKELWKGEGRHLDQ